jgi:ornithine cyclodeaminase/alanine dehydrogenase-like protein (mu-crystallin family)
MVRMIDEALSASIVDEQPAFDAAREAFLASSSEGSTYPIVAHVDETNRFTVKSASIDRTAAVKIGSYWPSNDTVKLPRNGSTVVLLDLGTGRLRAAIEAAEGNAYRTAAADELATSVRAPDDARTLTIIGTGHHPAYEARAVLRVRDFNTVPVTGRGLEAARVLAHELRHTPKPAPTSRWDAAARACWSRQPQPRSHGSKPSGLQTETHISAMGAGGPTKQEPPPALLQRSTLFCDIESQSRRIGVFREIAPEQQVTELGSVLHGTGADCSNRDEITVFDSSGFALQDFAFARAVRHRVQTNYEKTMETP